MTVCIACSAGNPASMATRSFRAAAKSSSPFIDRLVISAIASPKPQLRGKRVQGLDLDHGGIHVGDQNRFPARAQEGDGPVQAAQAQIVEVQGGAETTGIGRVEGNIRRRAGLQPNRSVRYGALGLQSGLRRGKIVFGQRPRWRCDKGQKCVHGRPVAMPPPSCKRQPDIESFFHRTATGGVRVPVGQSGCARL